MKKKTKSPITDKPLRQAGQSIDEEINIILNDQMLPYILYALLLIVMAIFEWYRLWTDMKPSPIMITIIALIATAFAAYKIITLKKRVNLMRQGSEGEKAVAEVLNQFREAKMRVHHDIVGDNFNIDHVVISTRGVYLIETKTYSKPEKGHAKIIFDGKNIIKNEYPVGDDIVIQVEAGRKWLSNLIEELTARSFEVKPVVLFPGWFVTMSNEHKSDVWMLNPKNLYKWIGSQTEVLTDEDVKLISNHLGRYIRKL